MSAGKDCVVVPLDGSLAGEAALPYAALIARAYALDVVAVHAVDQESLASAADLARAAAWFDTYVGEAATRHDVKVSTSTVVLGSAASAILDFAEGSRFIAIASHGRGGVRAALIGSVADNVVRGAEGPVVFVPCEGTSLAADSDVILIALDGSDRSLLGLEAGRELAAKLEANVALVRGWRFMAHYGGALPYAYVTPELLEAPKDEAEGYLATVVRPGEEAFTPDGYIPDAILQTADRVGARFIVVTASGKGVGKRLVLGSTTNRLMHSSKRALLIVPVTS